MSDVPMTHTDEELRCPSCSGTGWLDECDQCGHIIRDDDVGDCPNCGAPLDPEPTTEDPAPQSPKTE